MGNTNKIIDDRVLAWPTIKALRELGGSGSVTEIHDKIVEIEKVDDEILEVSRDDGTTEFYYKLAWARTYLKNTGYLSNIQRGLWGLTDKGQQAKKEDFTDGVIELVDSLGSRRYSSGGGKPAETEAHDIMSAESFERNEINDAEQEFEIKWRINLQKVLTEQMTPDGFERLIQRMLRMSGFERVEVTGRVGDGGIDGKGIATINGLISFPIVFQCKKYKDALVGPKELRDLRGAMQGRADRGLFITTSSFTRSALEEATRDGAPPIDTMDGEELADKLRELGLGLKTEMVEKVTVDADELLKI